MVSTVWSVSCLLFFYAPRGVGAAATRCHILRLKCTKFDYRRVSIRPSVRPSVCVSDGVWHSRTTTARNAWLACHRATNRLPADSLPNSWPICRDGHDDLRQSEIGANHLSSKCVLIMKKPTVWSVAPQRMWNCGGTGPAQSARNFFVVPLPLFGSKSTISRFGERFCDGQYSLSSFLFTVLLYTHGALCAQPLVKVGGGTCPRAIWSRCHWVVWTLNWVRLNKTARQWELHVKIWTFSRIISRINCIAYNIGLFYECLKIP